MKRSVLILAIVFMAAASIQAFAGVPENTSSKIQDLTAKRITDIPVSIDGKSTLPKTQGVKYTTIEQFESSAWTHLAHISPFAYEPTSGFLYITGIGRKFDTNGNFLGSYIQLFRSSDKGVSWDSNAVFSEDGYGSFYPSVIVTNPKKSTNINDIPVTIWGLFYTKSGTSWGATGGLSLQGSGSKWDDVEPIESPKTNNPNNGQFWNFMKMNSFVDGTEAFVAAAGMLASKSANFQYGYYGVRTWDVNGASEIASIVPSQWDVSKFKASTAMTSTYNGVMEIDFDNEGTLYASVNNVFLPEPVEFFRVPGVSKSIDMGLTWTDFNQVPKTVIDAYISSTGNTSWRAVDPYAEDAFVVTGPNEYSYFFTIGLWLEGDQNFRDIHLIECYYKGGAWGIRKVADINGFPQTFTRSDRYSTQTKYVYKMDTDPLGSELQAAKTKDGNNILLKWIDVTLPLPISPAFTIAYDSRKTDGTTEELTGDIDTLFTTDVFLTSRPVSSNSWAVPTNATNDSIANKVTWIPNVVPSLNEVPIIMHHTPNVTNAQHPAFGIPRPILQLVTDLWPILTYSTASTAVSVEEQPTVITNVSTSVYPNPAVAESQMVFNMKETGNVQIEVFNSLGQSVGVIYSGVQYAGIHALNFDVADYVSGAYYYTVTTSNGTETGKFNVVK
jgi:hypothetical protein